MSSKEANARIKINKLLEEAGWRFFDNKNGTANVVLENHVKITESHIDYFGENFEKTKNGFIDFLQGACSRSGKNPVDSLLNS